MRVHTLLWSVIATVGIAATLGGGYLIMNGPFFGGEVMDPVSLMGALAGFVIGLVAFALGGSKLMRSRVGY
jgi:hypothetical protein